MKCKHCRKKISNYARECPYCHTLVEDNPKEFLNYKKTIEASLQREEIRQNRAGGLRRKISYGVLSCVLVVAILVGTMYEKRRMRWELSDDTIAYLTDKNLILENYTTEKKEKLQSYSLSNQVQGYNLFLHMSNYYFESEQKHCVYYPMVNEGVLEGSEESVSLYSRDMKEAYHKDEFIADEVTSAVMDRDGTLYYLTKDSEVVTVYEGEKKLEIEVPGIKSLLYQEATNQVFAVTIQTNWHSSLNGNLTSLEDRSYAICYFDWEKQEWNKAFNMSDMMFSLGNKETAYYIYGNVLFSYGLITHKTKELASNVQCFTVELEGDKERVYYCCYSLSEHSYYDFVKDGFAKEDEGKETAATIRRERVRDLLKQQPLYTMDSDLYCYEDGKSTKVADDMVNAMSVQFGMPSSANLSLVSRQKEIEATYELHQDASDTIESIQKYYKESTDQGNIYLDSLYDWEREEGAVVKSAVIYSEDNASYVLRNNKIIQRENEVRAIWAESLTRTNGGTTYYYDEKEEVLKRKASQLDKEETVAENVFAFQVLGNGAVIVMAAEEEGEEYSLYEVDKSGNRKLIAKRVWGLLGKDTCYIKSAYVLEQVDGLEFK